MRLKPGFGYWDTTRFPAGGKFCRADRTDGKPIARVIRTFEPEMRYARCDIEVEFTDGTIGVLNSHHTAEDAERISVEREEHPGCADCADGFDASIPSR